MVVQLRTRSINSSWRRRPVKDWISGRGRPQMKMEWVQRRYVRKKVVRWKKSLLANLYRNRCCPLLRLPGAFFPRPSWEATPWHNGMACVRHHPREVRRRNRWRRRHRQGCCKGHAPRGCFDQRRIDAVVGQQQQSSWCRIGALLLHGRMLCHRRRVDPFWVSAGAPHL